MEKWTIVKKFKIDYAHRVYNQDTIDKNNKCKNIHGHTAEIEIFIEGNELNKQGMIIDFTNLKGLKSIINLFDHVLLVSIYDKEMKKHFKLDKALSGLVISDDYYYLGQHNSNFTYSNIMIVNNYISSEIIARILFYGIKQALYDICKENEIEKKFQLKKLIFHESNENSVIFEKE